MAQDGIYKTFIMSQPNGAWYALSNMETLDTPALVLFPDRIKHNINQAIAMVGDVARLRPHVKTHKCAEVARMMLESGIYQFKCATIAEAEMMGKAGAPDVLLAYQPTGPKLQRFIHLMSKYPATRFGCLTDHPAVAREQSAAFAATGVQPDVYIVLNVGMNRTGIAPGAAALALYQLVHELPGLQLRGLHAYDGHIRQPVFADKEMACAESYGKVLQMKQLIAAEGLPEPVLSWAARLPSPCTARGLIWYAVRVLLYTGTMVTASFVLSRPSFRPRCW